MFAISAYVTVCTFFIPSTVGVVVFSMAMGFLLSLDLRQFGAHCRGGPRVTRGDSGWRRGASSATPRWFGWQLCCREMLLYLGLLLGAMAEAGLLHHFLSPSQPQNLARGPQATSSSSSFSAGLSERSREPMFLEEYSSTHCTQEEWPMSGCSSSAEGVSPWLGPSGGCCSI
ncbi:unnamed protein product [Oncorhynchus mykiss]|uniref:Uncharacterized protein n=1 Tax=Oncorhynchus mykiss TaxID=8022 RepID=A0A060WWJ1_ONCMY|nr:unnamed protein product [Oncorhynchus mykiss]